MIRSRGKAMEKAARSRPSPVITAHPPLDPTPSFDQNAGHLLRHLSPPPVRGREEVLRREEGTPRAGTSIGKMANLACRVFLATKGDFLSRLPTPACHALGPDRVTHASPDQSIHRLSPSSATCASRRTGPSAPPKTRCVFRPPCAPVNPSAFCAASNQRTRWKP